MEQQLYSKETSRKKRNLHLLPESTAFSIMIIILFVVEAAFIFVTMTLDVLPAKYFIAVLVIMAAIDICLMLLMGDRGRKKTKRIIGLVILIVLGAVMCIGAYYMYDTYQTLQKISKYNQHFEWYDVVVSSDSKYNSEADIEGSTVCSYKTDSKMFSEGQEKLITESDVKYEMVDDCDAAVSLLSAKSDKADNTIIFIPDNNYKLFCDDDKNLEKTTNVLSQIKVIKRDDDNAARVDVTQDPYNICITGIDIWGSIDQVSRSDVNMIVTVNPQTKTILLTSMPRDSYVILHSFQQPDKLTHTGVWGVDETTSTIEDWLDIDINYYVRVNFSMLVDIVNAIGGVDVYSDYEFDSSIHDCHYVKGWNHLNGKQALYFARERHAFEDEDQQRIKDQQKVMKACLKKVTSSTALLTSYTKLLDAVDDEMETNMSQKEMSGIVKMQLNDMSKWKIKTQSVQGDLTMKGTYTMGLGRDLLVSIPREKSVEKVKKGIQEVMYPAN